MVERATVTFHTTPETKARLERLGEVLHRSKSYLTNTAVEKYLAEEEAFLADVEAGLHDLDTGQTMNSKDLKRSLAEHIKTV